MPSGSLPINLKIQSGSRWFRIFNVCMSRLSASTKKDCMHVCRTGQQESYMQLEQQWGSQRGAICGVECRMFSGYSHATDRTY